MMPEYIKNIVKETISTEKTYVHQLEILTEFFSVPLLERKLLTSSEHSAVFGQLSAIYSTNKWLLEELQSSEDNIVPVFIKFGPFLKAYSAYASHFQKSITALQECQSRCQELRKFISSTETRPEVKMSLSALLITPIQRIPRYKLLLGELLKHSDQEEDMSINISKALNVINSIADHLNNSLDDANMLQRLLVIQKAFCNQHPNIIVPGRQIIKEGCLNKVSKNGSSTQRRIFFLFSDVLLYAKAISNKVGKAFNYKQSPLKISNLKPNSLECCCILPVRYCQVTKLFGSTDHGVTFRLQCQAEDVVVYSNDAKEANKWMEAIGGTCKQAASKRSTLRKVSSGEKNQRQTPIRKRPNSKGIFSPGSNDLLSQLRSSMDCVPSPKVWLLNHRRNAKRQLSTDKTEGKRNKIS